MTGREFAQKLFSESLNLPELYDELKEISESLEIPSITNKRNMAVLDIIEPEKNKRGSGDVWTIGYLNSKKTIELTWDTWFKSMYMGNFQMANCMKNPRKELIDWFEDAKNVKDVPEYQDPEYQAYLDEIIERLSKEERTYSRDTFMVKKPQITTTSQSNKGGFHFNLNDFGKEGANMISEIKKEKGNSVECGIRKANGRGSGINYGPDPRVISSYTVNL